jgi:hypothetical protein
VHSNTLSQGRAQAQGLSARAQLVVTLGSYGPKIGQKTKQNKTKKNKTKQRKRKEKRK